MFSIRMLDILSVSEDTTFTEYMLDQGMNFLQSAIGFHDTTVQAAVHCSTNLVHTAVDDTLFVVESVQTMLTHTGEALAAVMDILSDFSHLQLICLLVLLFIIFGMKIQSKANSQLVTELKICGNLIRHVKWQKDMASPEMGELRNRLMKNKECRIPETITRIENIYKLLDRKLRYQTQLTEDLDFWGPTIMSQERKTRLLNKVWEDCENVRDIRNLGRHVDMELRKLKERLFQMTACTQKELTILDSLD